MVKRLIKTIPSNDCKIYAISHHNRLKVGKAEPNVEIYENVTEVPTIGTNSIRYKNTYFSVAICPDPTMDEGMTAEILKGLTAFDLSMLLPNKDTGRLIQVNPLTSKG